jgi:hypothetical protein
VCQVSFHVRPHWNVVAMLIKIATLVIALAVLGGLAALAHRGMWRNVVGTRCHGRSGADGSIRIPRSGLRTTLTGWL